MTDEKLQSFLRNLADGFDEEGSVEFYRHFRQWALDRYVEVLGNDAPEGKPVLLPMLKAMAGFFPYADPNSAEVIDHHRRLHLVFRDEDIERAGASIEPDKA
jgi:hypothetical protein